MTLPEVSTRGKVLGVLGLCCISYVLGRGQQKTITVERIREVEKVAEQKVEAAKAETAVAKRAADSDTTQWRTKTVYLPGGVVEVIKEVIRERDNGVVETRVQTVTKVVTQERVVFKDRVRDVSAPLPKWAVGAAAGVDLGGRLRYGGQIERRVAGRLWVTAGVDVATRAAAIGVRLEF